MPGKYTIMAQLSSVHSSEEDLAPRRVADHVARIADAAPLDILVVGWQERPELYRALTAPESRPAPEVFLWYPLLSDYPEFSIRPILSSTAPPRGAGDGPDTTAPGSPRASNKRAPTIRKRSRPPWPTSRNASPHIPSTGCSSTRFRFPSAANGLKDVFSCFCPHCASKAAASGLDLEAVRAFLQARTGAGAPEPASAAIPDGAPWLEALVANQPLLQRFLRFRADSITGLIAMVSRRMRALGRKVSLDVFSPGLAPLVGQDFAALAPGADWVKPMIYRFGRGPSALRSEIPSLVRELGAYLGLGEAAAMAWAARHVDGLAGQTVEAVEAIAPLSLIRAETEHALALLGGTPLYLGLETVSIAGLMEVTPRNVEEILEIGVAAGVQGFALSWDLLHTPVENVRPLRSLLGGS